MKRVVTALVSAAVVAGALTACVPKNPRNLPVDHIVVLMQENRSADTYLGQLHSQGQPAYEAEPTTGNPDPLNPSGPPILPFHKTTYCESSRPQPLLERDAPGVERRRDGRVHRRQRLSFGQRRSDRPDAAPATMGYYDQTDLPFYYGLYNTFATNDHYFQSVLSPDVPEPPVPARGNVVRCHPQRRHVCSYPEVGVRAVGRGLRELEDLRRPVPAVASDRLFFKYVNDRAAGHVFPMSQYFADAAAGTLPNVSFVDPEVPGYAEGRERRAPAVERPGGPEVRGRRGQRSHGQPELGFVGAVLDLRRARRLLRPRRSAGGAGARQHPPEPPARRHAGAFDRYGFRVPVAVVSPYAKPHYVSHVIDDHTSILRFIELRFGLPALTQPRRERRSDARHVRLLQRGLRVAAAVADRRDRPGQLAACPG